MRTITALTAAAGLLIALSACSTSAPSGDCQPSQKPGDASSTITADGAFGANPEAEFPTPLLSDGLQVSTVKAGTGDLVYPGQYATVGLSLLDGETGEYLGGAYDRADDAIVLRSGAGRSEIGYAVECQTVGSRIAITLKGEDLYGLLSISEATLEADQPMVAIVDIYDSLLAKAHGQDQVPQPGMPTVVLTPSGQPGLSVPSEDPPAALKIAVLKQADGDAVEEGDTVYMHFLRLDWANPSNYKSTWEDYGTPSAFTAQELDPTTGIGMPPGILQSIVGQKVGSQVLVVIPPAFGFPEGLEPAGISAGQTLVYVFDILGVG